MFIQLKVHAVHFSERNLYIMFVYYICVTLPTYQFQLMLISTVALFFFLRRVVFEFWSKPNVKVVDSKKISTKNKLHVFFTNLENKTTSTPLRFSISALVFELFYDECVTMKFNRAECVTELGPNNLEPSE